jgi:hypothetical protein
MLATRDSGLVVRISIRYITEKRRINYVNDVGMQSTFFSMDKNIFLILHVWGGA